MGDVLGLEDRYLAPTYERQPLTFVRGKGIRVEDDKGEEYLDFVGGIGVCALGHSHPAVAEAISTQARKLVHVSNLYHIQSQVELAESLAQITPPSIEKFFFCNSGAEAVEGALKLAVKHTKRRQILALQGSFHGRTAATVAATWEKSLREPFEALAPPAFKFAPFDDLEGVRKKINNQTAAVIAEPVQGEGGINVPSKDFLPGLREICDDIGSLLIFDEVQSGMGKTGRWFGCEHWNVKPDIITVAKALGNGFPIGCMGAKGEVIESFSPGDHASTFGGNPLACAAGKAVIRVMKEQNLPRRAERIGKYFKNRLEAVAEEHKVCLEARGKGLMLGLELENEEAAKLAVSEAMKMGFLINRTAGNVLRFVPPLIVRREHIDQLIDSLNKILGEMDDG